MTAIKLVLAAAALGAAAHPTPKVVLVKHADFIRQTLPSAKQYFLRTVSIGKQDLAAIRQAGDFTPADPDVQFFLGQGEGGATVGVVLFQQVDTPHGPIEVGLTFGPNGAVAHAMVTTATVETKPWVLEAVGTSSWRGTPLRGVLAEAGVLDDAVEVVFTGLDHGLEGEIDQDYQRSLPFIDAHRPEVLLAYGMNGMPLPPQHGFPLRLLVPGWYGMASVKWLGRITVVDRPFEGYQQTHSYRVRGGEDEPGEPLTRMQPRALMVPPGHPEFSTRSRIVEAGRQLVVGRAWSGWGAIESVEVSLDGGQTWAAAELDEDLDGPWAWRGWSFEWHALPGTYELCCRARDEAGNEQPLEPEWNVGGYANNAVQRVLVTVE